MSEAESEADRGARHGEQERVLVYCANGFQGQAIATALLGCGYRVRALVRDKARAAELAAAGAELVLGDLGDEQSLRAAHSGVDIAVMQLPSGVAPDVTLAEAANALGAIRAVGVERIVLNSSVDFPSRSDELPQFAAKQQVERQVLDSGAQVSGRRTGESVLRR